MELLEKIKKEINLFFDGDYDSKKGRNSDSNFKLISELALKYKVGFQFDDDRNYSFSDEALFYISNRGEFIEPPNCSDNEEEVKFMKKNGRSYYFLGIKLSDVGNYFHFYINEKKLDEHDSIVVGYTTFSNLEGVGNEIVSKARDDFEAKGLLFIDDDLLEEEIDLNLSIDYPELYDTPKSVMTYLFGEI
jgi:hypothetical protein